MHLAPQGQFQSEKVTPTRRDRCGAVIGRVDAPSLANSTVQLGVLLGLAE